MRFSAIFAAASLAIGLGRACNVVKGVKVTFYGFSDNSPPGDGVAYNCAGRDYHAKGDGSYDNPLTFASDPKEYKPCEIVYFPYLKKYLRMEDQCAQCITDYGNGIKHVDIWTGKAATSCENNLTPDGTQVVVRDPPKNLSVDTSALYADGKCNKGATNPGAAGSC
ncbi:hypothetical protein GQ53DRAFT_859961 [Thozetella sp. PMI_491]|nr:hypothetical protein GQ53DRAFT_859961 [Thozetella sp. PMI_491]